MQNNIKTSGLTQSIIKILFIGDIVGRPGRKTVAKVLPELKEKEQLDVIIANGENSAGGFGIQEKVYEELISCGIDVITLGNHAWSQKEFVNFISRCDRLIRPANFPDGSPGKGSLILEKDDFKIGVLNLQGRVFMEPIDCPFIKGKAEIEKLKKNTPLIIVDFHAEATSEKLALGHFLGDSISALLGTHTHIQTADERLIQNHTAYITDVGMTGAYDSILGMKKEMIMQWMIYHLPAKFIVGEGTTIFNGVILEIDKFSGKSKSIKRLNFLID